MSNNHPATILSDYLAERNFKTDFYFDRVKIYFDAHTKPDDVDFILQANSKNKLIEDCLPHNDFFVRRLDLFQPEIDDMSMLKPLGDYAINYVEFSLDFATKRKKDLEQVIQFFTHHLVFLRKTRRNKHQAYHHKHKETNYYTPKGVGMKFSDYPDKPSRKHPGMRCFHLECRLSGWNLLKTIGIFTLTDLLVFDNEALWNELLDLRKPNYETLGRFICNDNATRQAQNKRGKKEWAKIDSLQEYLSVNADWHLAFDRLNDVQLPKWFDNYMSE